MAKKNELTDPAERTADLVRKMIIIQLGLAGVGQAQIRKIAGGAMGEINGIVKLLRGGKRPDRD
jgi:hypothetical protein